MVKPRIKCETVKRSILHQLSQIIGPAETNSPRIGVAAHQLSQII